MPKTKEVSSPTPRKLLTAKNGPSPEQIQLRAYEIYLERCGAPGNAFEDWVQAERELLQSPRKNGRTAKTKAAA
jgi:hypothetical protein